MTTVGGIEVRGVDVDSQSRCTHYATDRDVVAIAFACCRTFYSCYRCHETVADHPTETWAPEAFDERAILCGVCGEQLPIESYLDSVACPACDASFNPNCADHYPLYFDV